MTHSTRTQRMPSLGLGKDKIQGTSIQDMLPSVSKVKKTYLSHGCLRDAVS